MQPNCCKQSRDKDLFVGKLYLKKLGMGKMEKGKLPEGNGVDHQFKLKLIY
jgi:hypothetical protein